MSSCRSSKRATDPEKPNIVIIFTDDQGYEDLGCFGSKTIKTPRLDRMAAEGLKLTNFYAQPVCGVSRAALMTGCYPIRVGAPRNMKQLHTVPHPKEVTMAEVLSRRCRKCSSSGTRLPHPSCGDRLKIGMLRMYVSMMLGGAGRT